MPEDIKKEIYIDKISKVFDPTKIKSDFVEKLGLQEKLVSTPIPRLCLLTALYTKKICSQNWSDKKSTSYDMQTDISRCKNFLSLFNFLNCNENYLNLFSNVQNTNFDYLIENHTNKRNKAKTNLSSFKRLPFKAWGGKRFNQVGTEKVQTSKVPFNAWGGKRNYNGIEFAELNGDTDEFCKRSKTKFYSWGGKKK